MEPCGKRLLNARSSVSAASADVASTADMINAYNVRANRIIVIPLPFIGSDLHQTLGQVYLALGIQVIKPAACRRTLSLYSRDCISVIRDTVR